MPIHPEAQKILDLVEKAARPEYWELSPEEAKASHEKAFPVLDIAPVPLKRVESGTLPRPRGAIPMRVYWPDEPADATGAMLWIHGGGHVVGSIDCYDAVCRTIARDGGHVIVSTSYGLAPEHKFPTAVEDCLAALQWVYEHAGSIGVDPMRVMVGGDSAGGNLAAVTALLARDLDAPELRHQLLVYPVTAPWPDSRSHQVYGEGHLLTGNNIDWFQENYIRGSADREDYRFAPLLCHELAGLPPATVMVAECDPLHDEGVAYAERMAEAGNDVELIDYPGMLHGFLNMGGWLADSRDALQRCVAIMRNALT